MMTSSRECNGGVDFDWSGTYHVPSLTQSDSLNSGGLDPLTPDWESVDASQLCASHRLICDHERLLPAWMVGSNSMTSSSDDPSNMAAMPLSAFYSTPLFTDCRQPTVGNGVVAGSTRSYTSASTESAPTSDQNLAQHHYAYETPVWTAPEYRSARFVSTTPPPPNRLFDSSSTTNCALTTYHPTEFVSSWNDYVERWYRLANLHWTAQQIRNDDVNRAVFEMNASPENCRAQERHLRDWASNHIAASLTTTSHDGIPPLSSSCFDDVTPPTGTDRSAFQPARSIDKRLDESLPSTELSLSPRAVIARLPPFQLPQVVDVSKTSASRQPLLARRLVMEPSAPRRHVCPDCGVEFAHLHSVRRHQRVHNGQRPYRCSICADTFTQSGNLKRHMRTKHCK